MRRMARRVRDRSGGIVPIFTVSAFVWVANANFEICHGGDHANHLGSLKTFSLIFPIFFLRLHPNAVQIPQESAQLGTPKPPKFARILDGTSIGICRGPS